MSETVRTPQKNILQELFCLQGKPRKNALSYNSTMVDQAKAKMPSPNDVQNNQSI
jgi:hypothetical protein